MQSMRKKDLSTSTPLLTKNIFDAVTPESVSEVMIYNATTKSVFIIFLFV